MVDAAPARPVRTASFSFQVGRLQSLMLNTTWMRNSWANPAKPSPRPTSTNAVRIRVCQWVARPAFVCFETAVPSPARWLMRQAIQPAIARVSTTPARSQARARSVVDQGTCGPLPISGFHASTPAVPMTPSATRTATCVCQAPALLKCIQKMVTSAISSSSASSGRAATFTRGHRISPSRL